ncbi:UNVERIFIED_CONTAM: hypothetical protein Sradi_6547700 [Sesamum radiatum]|uniref:Retrotransposon gag protein n=1 Tax=Sesamum radiatum TaxID=300843 RepID=A0AAW2JWM6_SESRA
MPRSSRTGERKFDLEIERTARRLSWETKQHTKEASTSYEDERDITLEFKEFTGESEEEIIAIIPERTIKDMASPDLNQQPLCIEYPDLEGEDPHKHSKEFHVVCSGMRPQGITEEQIPDHLLIQYFYEGLSSMDRKLIDAVSGGALFNKTPTEAHNLIFIMASNTQQFGTRYDDPPRKSNEVTFDDRLNELTSLVKNIVVERNQHVKACGICTSPEYVTDMCPTLQTQPAEHANAIGGFSGQQQRRYDPFSNTYNSRWKDHHPNLSYGAQ